MDACVRLTVRSPADAELAADLLWAHGATAVRQDHGALVAGFPDAARAADAVAVAGVRWAASVETVGREWSQAWRRWSRPRRVGRLWVRPAWTDGPAPPNTVEVVVEPGDAFGSGDHPSTRLCLGAVEAGIPPGRTVLDVGCGSGILSVAAARLGARAVGVDTDPAAPAVAAANAARNGVSGSCLFLAGPVDAVTGRFDLVVANLGGALAPIALAGALITRCAPGGRLVLGGLLVGQDAAVAQAFSGRRVVGRAEDEGWVSLTLA